MAKGELKVYKLHFSGRYPLHFIHGILKGRGFKKCPYCGADLQQPILAESPE